MTEKPLDGLPGGEPFIDAPQAPDAKPQTPKKPLAPKPHETEGTYVLHLNEPIDVDGTPLKEITFGRVTMAEVLLAEDYEGRSVVEESEVAKQKLMLEMINEATKSMTGLTDHQVLSLDPIDWVIMQSHILYKLGKKQQGMMAKTKELGGAIDLPTTNE